MTSWAASSFSLDGVVWFYRTKIVTDRLLVVLRLLFAHMHVCHKENHQASTSSINQSVCKGPWASQMATLCWLTKPRPSTVPLQACSWSDGDHQQTQWVQPSLSFRCRCKERAGCMCILWSSTCNSILFHDKLEDKCWAQFKVIFITAY